MINHKKTILVSIFSVILTLSGCSSIENKTKASSDISTSESIKSKVSGGGDMLYLLSVTGVLFLAYALSDTVTSE